MQHCIQRVSREIILLFNCRLMKFLNALLKQKDLQIKSIIYDVPKLPGRNIPDEQASRTLLSASPGPVGLGLLVNVFSTNNSIACWTRKKVELF